MFRINNKGCPITESTAIQTQPKRRLTVLYRVSVRVSNASPTTKPASTNINTSTNFVIQIFLKESHIMNKHEIGWNINCQHLPHFWNVKDGLRINLLLVNRLMLSTCQLYRAHGDDFQTASLFIDWVSYKTGKMYDYLLTWGERRRV